jgi:hypothetical protein
MKLGWDRRGEDARERQRQKQHEVDRPDRCGPREGIRVCIGARRVQKLLTSISRRRLGAYHAQGQKDKDFQRKF